MILVALFCATNIFAEDYIATQCYTRDKVKTRVDENENSVLSSMYVKIDMFKIVIYSPLIQEYTICRVRGSYTDPNGNSISEFDAIDKYGVKCTIKLIVRFDIKRLQIYIMYNNNKQWAYDLEKINQNQNDDKKHHNIL